jgi:2-methylcitrate dehydratase PrpD
MDKVSVDSDPRYEGYNMRGSAEITMKNGEVHQREVLEPHGLHPRSPLTNAENEELFRSRAGTVISEKQMSKIVDTVYTLETLDDIATLTQLLVVPQS